jgi:hypothetical protein
MALATWVDIYGTGAVATLVNGKTQITFFPENVPNSGLGNLQPTATNAPEKSLAALITGNSKRTFTEVDNNVVVAAGFTGIQIAQRNNVAKLQQDFTVSLYSAATGVPAITDPDDV